MKTGSCRLVAAWKVHTCHPEASISSSQSELLSCRLRTEMGLKQQDGLNFGCLFGAIPHRSQLLSTQAVILREVAWMRSQLFLAASLASLCLKCREECRAGYSPYCTSITMYGIRCHIAVLNSCSDVLQSSDFKGSGQSCTSQFCCIKKHLILIDGQTDHPIILWCVVCEVSLFKCLLESTLMCCL